MPLDPEAQAVLDEIGAVGQIDPYSLSPDQWREAYAGTAAGQSGAEVDRVQDLEATGADGAIPVRVYTPPEAGSDVKPGLVYFHGGGWVLGGLDTHDATCRALSVGGDCVVVSVDYRLAPEAKFPAAPDTVPIFPSASTASPSPRSSRNSSAVPA